MRPKAARALCAAAFAVGLAWRCVHVLSLHPPGAYVYSDMKWYVDDAVRYSSPGHEESANDTLHPPGNAYLLGAFYRLDRSWSLAAAAELVLSALAPLAIAAIGLELGGSAVAGAALCLASLYPPFVDYAGYFLAENPFLVCVSAATALLLAALRVRSERRVFALSWGAGLLWGAGAALKANALASALPTALALLATPRRSARLAAGGLAAGLLAFLLPLSLRCGALSGRPCLVSTNWAYNAVLGHCGETRFVLWRNVFGEDRWKGWRAPAGTERGYTQDLLLPFDSYDTRANAAWAWAWTRAHPGEALRSSVRHVWDLLASRPFPSAEDPRWAAFARFGQWFFWIFVLAPAALGLAQRRPGLAEALLLLPLVGLAAAAFLTIGESRYRVPYDGLLIVLAARTYLEALGPMVPRGGPRS